MPYNIIFVYLIFMSRVLYFLHSTSVLSFYIDVALTPSITQDCRHWIHMNVCRVSCGGVSNMLLVLSITFYFHFNIWVCMCSTGLFQYRWLKGYISIAHVIIIIKSEVTTFPIVIIFFRGCVPEMFVTSYSVTYCIYIPGKPGIYFHYHCAVYDESK